MRAQTAKHLLFGATTLLGAFLVFQVQPIISKTILPWFGGSPAVWTTCMLFFQVVLFGGYAYAHGLTKLPQRRQILIHVTALVIAVLTLPITPGNEWKPAGESRPQLHILLLLLAQVGLPYFLVSSTGPLIQAWFSRANPGASPYRLYALSNVGSLAALLTYPVLFEPYFATDIQGRIWSTTFFMFVVVCCGCAATLWKAKQPLVAASNLRARRRISTVNPPMPRHPFFAWLGYPALASVLLLATTNHVCQDVAVIPFLWVLPLSLYLITFIICFDRDAWYLPRVYGGASLALIVMASFLTLRGAMPGILLETSLYLSLLFCACMVCHGELARRKPDPAFLTKYYLLISAGGALGGFFVAIVAPALFDSFAELNLALLATFVVSATAIGWLPSRVGERNNDRNTDPETTGRVRWGWAAVLMVAFVFVLRAQAAAVRQTGTQSSRNFYGVLRMTAEGTNDPHRAGKYMLHGRIAHGFQYDHPELRNRPTMYYTDDSGIGVTMTCLQELRPRLRVGLVGLGVGTLAAYGREADEMRFYEINPDVIDWAKRHFTFLGDCRSSLDVVLGDARLSLERETPQAYDLLVLDAFSGDALPTHLLTAEAVELYCKHLKPNGVLAFNISNRHLDLERVLGPLAERHGLSHRAVIVTQGVETFRSPSHWFIMSAAEEFLTHAKFVAAARPESSSRLVSIPIWTDRYNNLLHVLK